MIATIQTQNRSLVALIDDQKRQHETKRKEVEVLEQQLNRGIRLPYLVASIAEVKYLLFDIIWQVISVPVEDDDNLAKPVEKQEFEEGVIMSTIQKKVKSEVFLSSRKSSLQIKVVWNRTAPRRFGGY